jgi:hypothetical protein
MNCSFLRYCEKLLGNGLTKCESLKEACLETAENHRVACRRLKPAGKTNMKSLGADLKVRLPKQPVQWSFLAAC